MKTKPKELSVVTLEEEDESNPHPGKRLVLTFNDGRVLTLDFSLVRHAPWTPALGILDVITLRTGKRGRALCVVVRGDPLPTGIIPYFFWRGAWRGVQGDLAPYLTRADRAIRRGWIGGVYPYIGDLVLTARAHIFAKLDSGTLPDYKEG